MSTNSTSKMLAKLARKGKSVKSVAPEVESKDYIPEPKLTPNAEMEQILANILGPSLTKKNTPLDK